ncbi:MAG: chromosomal replication initiator protein DnaA [Patescibacteria group bacterium]
MDEQLTEIWQKTLETVAPLVRAPSFNTWLKPTRAVAYEDGILYVEVDNDFARGVLENRYVQVLLPVLREYFLSDPEIRFILPNADHRAAANETRPQRRQAEQGPGRLFLNPRYTFENFVVGESNSFAHNASLAVAEAPGKSYNPLFIYGGVGLGKTHLMHAIGHFVLEHQPSAKVIYVTSERFTNDIINGIMNKNTATFREKYRSVDVLLVDDIQFLGRKERTQEEFFHTFNTLYEANRQIVISCDRPPREIPGLEDRLRSRFESGLITDIQAPELETRIAILRKKAAADNWRLPDDVVYYIADQINSNIRELEGALIRVVAYASFNNRELTRDLADEVLKDTKKTNQRKITIPMIQEVVADFFQIGLDEMKAHRRTKVVTLPRQIAMYISRELTEASLPKIGEQFGGRDHTTVIHACEKISALTKEDPSVEKIIKDIMARLRE